MKEETTSRLEKIMKTLKDESHAEGFSSEHALPSRAFNEYINDYIAEKDIIVSEMVQRSGISKNYVYNILNGITKSPGRDKIIAICIAAGMNLDELNRGLQLSGNNKLYPKNKRDIYIATCVNQGLTDVTKINLELEKSGIEIINV